MKAENIVVDKRKHMVTWAGLAPLMGQTYKMVLRWKALGAPEVDGKTCVEWVEKWLDKRAEKNSDMAATT